MCGVFAACSDEEENKEVIFKDGAQTTQTIYADETKTKNEGIEFTTTGPWTAEVTETTTRATDGGIEWLKLNQYSGDKAGAYTLILTLKENFTGVDRKAAIKILCNSTVTTISVEQKGKKEDGTIPEAKSGKLISKIVVTEEYSEYAEEDEDDTYEMIFTYDEQNRLIKISDAAGEAFYSYTYSNKTIIEKDYEKEYTYTIDNDRIVSWSTEEPDEKQSGKHHYDENGYLTLVEKTRNVKNGTEPVETYTEQEFCEWKEGNMVQAGEKGNDKFYASMEYGDIDNTTNLDLNYLLPQTEMLWGLAFGEERMIKLLGYMGKRSAKLMTKETDDYRSHTYEYKMNDDKTIGSISIVSHKADGTVTEKIKYTLTYMDAK